MKITLDQLQPDGSKWAAYVRLEDDNGEVIARATVPYDGDADAMTEKAKTKFADRVKAELEKQQAKTRAEDDIRQALAMVDLKEVSK